VAEGIATYLSEVCRFRSAKTIAACERILGLFEASLRGRSLISQRRDNLLDHMGSLTDKGLASRTIYNHCMKRSAPIVQVAQLLRQRYNSAFRALRPFGESTAAD
jgi:hypothetical protein